MTRVAHATRAHSGPSRSFGAAKRAIDVAGSLVALAVTLPVMGLIALLVRATLGRPVLYSQTRIGRGERAFTLFKFRTMRDVWTADETLRPDGERLTRLGRLLRATSLDELPELASVLAGDMSLVGPRPLLREYLDRYSAEQRRRHEVRPGITGWAQVQGRNAISWERRFELDVWYVDHMSLVLDLKILATTAVRVLLRQGISHAGHATMPAFTGGAGETNAPTVEGHQTATRRS